MAILDTRSRSGYLFLAVAVGHIILISAQVNVKSGVPLLQAVVFGAFAEVQRATTGAVRVVAGVWDGYVGLQNVHRQNEVLKKENEYLRVKLQQTRALALESQSLRQALALRERANLPMRAAEIIGTSATADFRTVTIDRGTADGIKADMPVVAAAGAVGRVVLPSRHAAKVQLLVDRSAAAAVKVERSGAQGIAMGSGESLLRMEYVSTTADLKVGDEVVTSGIDGVYPPGFAVGRIETLDRTGGTFRAIRIRPAVTFSDLEEVLVVLQAGATAGDSQKPADPAKADAAPAKPPGAAPAPGAVEPAVRRVQQPSKPAGEGRE
jgi:rod shape-determining protein MreC